MLYCIIPEDSGLTVSYLSNCLLIRELYAVVTGSYKAISQWKHLCITCYTGDSPRNAGGMLWRASMAQVWRATAARKSVFRMLRGACLRFLAVSSAM